MLFKNQFDVIKTISSNRESVLDPENTTGGNYEAFDRWVEEAKGLKKSGYIEMVGWRSAEPRRHYLTVSCILRTAGKDVAAFASYSDYRLANSPPMHILRKVGMLVVFIGGAIAIIAHNFGFYNRSGDYQDQKTGLELSDRYFQDHPPKT